MVGDSAEVRSRVRRLLGRLVDGLDVLEGDVGGREAGRDALAELCGVLGMSELPAALDEYLCVAGGENEDMLKELHRGESRPSVSYLIEEAPAMRTEAIAAGADADRVEASVPWTWTAEAVLLVDGVGADPAVWYVLEDGETGQEGETFTAWLESSVELVIQTQELRSHFRSVGPRSMAEIEELVARVPPHEAMQLVRPPEGSQDRYWQLRAKVAERAWRQFVARAAEQGLDLGGFDWAGPPESDELRARWLSKFPDDIVLGPASCTPDPYEFDLQVGRWLDECADDSIVRCLFQDPMLGVVEIPAGRLRADHMVPTLLDVAGSMLVIVLSDGTAVRCDADNERDCGRYKVAEI